MNALVIPTDTPAYTMPVRDHAAEHPGIPVRCSKLDLMLLAHVDAAETERNQNLALLQVLGLRGRVHGTVIITGTEPGVGVPESVIELGRTLTSSAYAIDPARTPAGESSVRQDFEVFIPRGRRTGDPRIPSGGAVHPRVDQRTLDEELERSHARVAQRMDEAYSRLSRLLAAHRTNTPTGGGSSELTQVLVASADEILDVLDLARTHAAAGMDDRFVHRTHALSTRLLALTGGA